MLTTFVGTVERWRTSSNLVSIKGELINTFLKFSANRYDCNKVRNFKRFASRVKSHFIYATMQFLMAIKYVILTYRCSRFSYGFANWVLGYMYSSVWILFCYTNTFETCFLRRNKRSGVEIKGPSYLSNDADSFFMMCSAHH